MKIVVYSREGCAPCKTLKYWLSKKGISYEERQPDDSVFILPTVLCAGQRLEGLNIRRLAELIGA